MRKNDDIIAIYSRKSKFTGKGESIGNQVELCKEYVRVQYGDAAVDKVVVYEDEGFSLRLLLCNPNIVTISYSVYYYRLNPTSITKSKNSDRGQMFEEYASNVKQFIESVAVQDCYSEILSYCLISCLTANLLYNGKGCGIKRMSALYSLYNEIIKSLPGEICKNKYIALKCLKSEPFPKRQATWLVLRARRLKLDKLLFLIDSKL